jgi:hypothetical protein
MKKPALLDSEILDRELGYLCRLFDAGLANLDDLLCDHLGNRIVAVHKRERAQASERRLISSGPSGEF